MTTTNIALTSYAAKKCARRTHNEFAGLPKPELSAQAEVFIEHGREFEKLVISQMIEAFKAAGRVVVVAQPTDVSDMSPVPDLLVLAEQPGQWDASVEVTMAALDARVPVIIGGRLSDVGARRGAPDILVAVDDGYLPVDIKGHMTFKASQAKNPDRAGTVALSTVLDPAIRQVVRGGSNKSNAAGDDCMQLSHYVRMLEDLGYAPPEATGAVWAGIVGTSDLSALIDNEHGVMWYDLADGDDRSYLSIYDAAFRVRLMAAEAASAGGETVRPFRISECKSCPWYETCAEVVGPDDASFAITTGLPTADEWNAIYPPDRRLTVGELAAFPIKGLPSTKAWDQRIRRAQMTVAGIDFEPHDGPGGTTQAVPTADVEIDFDIEWDTDGRIYQWGVRVRRDRDETTARYVPDLVSFEPLDTDSEAALAQACLKVLEDVIDEAEGHGKSVTIFHWSDPEKSYTRRSIPAITSLVDTYGLDLRRWAEANLFATRGYSLKVIAPACGFAWRGDDAGGLESQRLLNIARAGGPDAAAATKWCLEYNEDDVRAQAAIRDEWVRREATTWGDNRFWTDALAPRAGNPRRPSSDAATRPAGLRPRGHAPS